MNMKQKDRGFTLVELIIVIAIIGILAAVLIPTIGGYIEKAHRGRDVELAGNMTRDVSLYATEYDVEIDELTGVDVRTILLFNNYDLVPRRDKWVFVYDKTTNQVVVKDINKDGIISSDPAPTNPIDPTHIEENYFLISKGKNSIEKAVNLMVNLSARSDYTSALGLSNDKYDDVISKFDPANTVFLDNGGIFTEAEATSDEDVATRMVVLELTSSLPAISEDDYLKMNLAETQIYPKTIRTSDPKSLLKSHFKGVKDIDTRKIYKIDLPPFGEGNLEGSIYEFKLGDYVVDSFKQTVSDEVIGMIEKKDSNGIVVGYIIKRQLTVSYFNKEGLFAQGSIVYAVLEDVNPKP